MAGGCGGDPSQSGAQAEDGSAGCRASAAVADGRSVSPHLGGKSGGAGRAAVAGASAQASAVADASQEPAAGDGAEPGSAAEAEAVDAGRAGGVGEVRVVALRGGAAEATAAVVGPAGSGDREEVKRRPTAMK